MKKFENYISNLRVLERADQEALDGETVPKMPITHSLK